MREPNAIEAVVGWMDAMRRGDLAAVGDWFDPRVSWRGVPDVALIAPNAETVVLGAKVPGLSEIGGVDVGGRLFNVFRVTGGRIVEVADYVRRDDALAAAGAQAPPWR